MSALCSATPPMSYTKSGDAGSPISKEEAEAEEAEEAEEVEEAADEDEDDEVAS